ncbi:hypothetical protein K493DRAFT_314558 [Basidiobolus meristosporus CBS 931.73]|uniref:C2H2-type domain-containing protein n=1 Tax=Basidiobolus meristosporus CBS 931.73 TaxID=1314790 RepID=A0A1Y1YEB9_9FUNG|nr:hypothetical protein K493DRAFT_314558 [Basidiobolus meristosporus CBS 931.73]|eukprot:ORX96380.1 hypothetical protein K493DRAFT_314558 [Basidiobolus meristosporus CBS 931.73]
MITLAVPELETILPLTDPSDIQAHGFRTPTLVKRKVILDKYPGSIDSNVNIVETLGMLNKAHTLTQNAPKHKAQPRKWVKRSTIIKTLTGEVSISSWRPDGAPQIERPAAVSKFNTPFPVDDALRPVQCTYPGCNRNFADQSGLTKHSVIHGPKTLRCGLNGCTKCFADRTRLRRHQRGVHGQ